MINRDIQPDLKRAQFMLLNEEFEQNMVII